MGISNNGGKSAEMEEKGLWKVIFFQEIPDSSSKLCTFFSMVNYYGVIMGLPLSYDSHIKYSVEWFINERWTSNFHLISNTAQQFLIVLDGASSCSMLDARLCSLGARKNNFLMFVLNRYSNCKLGNARRAIFTLILAVLSL